MQIRYKNQKFIECWSIHYLENQKVIIMFLKWTFFCTEKEPSWKCLFNLYLKRKIFWFKVEVAQSFVVGHLLLLFSKNYQSCEFYSIEPWLVIHCWKFSRDPKIVLIFSSKVVTQGPSRKCTFSSASNSLRPSFAFLKHLNEWKYCWTFTLNQM